MSIENNTTELQSILETVNELPTQENLDAELSTQDTLISDIMTALEGKTAGGGTQVNTCSVTLQHGGSQENNYFYLCTRFVDGAFVTEGRIGSLEYKALPVTLTDVVCGSALFIRHADTNRYGGVGFDITTSCGSTFTRSATFLQAAITVQSTPNVTETITITPDLDS